MEVLALRHQLNVLQRSVTRPKLTAADRFLWARLVWTWKVRRGHPGRPPVSQETRNLIRQMSRENPLWGAPRIHGELLKLSIDIGETSVGKYMARLLKPPSQTWRTFLANHVKSNERLAHDRHHIARMLRSARGNLETGIECRTASPP